MRTVRFEHQGQVLDGALEADQIRVYDSAPLHGGKPTNRSIPVSEGKLLTPVVPSKLICIGMNYAAHAAEIAQDVPEEPLMFYKPVSAIIGPEDTIELPWQSDQVELEAELGIVIGTRAKNVSESEALKYVFGFTIGNDVTARDLQFSDLQWARSKGFDTFCPLGPWIETDFDPKGKQVESRINGELRQHAITDDMLHGVEKIVSYVSENITLLPGDVILTGSPAGISRIVAGDVVECEIEGIGVLRNPVS